MKYLGILFTLVFCSSSFGFTIICHNDQLVFSSLRLEGQQSGSSVLIDIAGELLYGDEAYGETISLEPLVYGDEVIYRSAFSEENFYFVYLTVPLGIDNYSQGENFSASLRVISNSDEVEVPRGQSVQQSLSCEIYSLN